MAEPNESHESQAFESVLGHELCRIENRRSLVHDAPELRNGACPSKVGAISNNELLTASNSHLVGLAFSGGGIRSATFNLGLLQGLADLKLLPLVDYLSTVSGGGYVGAWLAAWIQRAGNLAAVQM